MTSEGRRRIKDDRVHKSVATAGGSASRERQRTMCHPLIALTGWLLCFVLVACGSDAHLSGVKFRIVAQDTGEPLGNRSLDVYHFVYDVQYDSRDAPWYITSVSTDDEGVFPLDLSRVDVGHIVVQPGKPYGIVRFERASDLQHTGSTDHVRVVRFEAGGTRVEGNAVYDLKRRTVRIIPVSGDAWEESYSEIRLMAPAYEPSRSAK
jgi:hypothetical protein